MAETGRAKRMARRRKTARTAPDPATPVPVENIRPGTILHLGDGRRIAFGETAEVDRRVAAGLRRNKQVRTDRR